MKQFYLVLKLLFVASIGNVSFGQIGPYFGGATCEDAVPIEIGEAYESNDIAGDDWYYFVAPCDGELEVTNCMYDGNKHTVLYSGSCGSLETERIAEWDDCSTNDMGVGYAMSAGETVYIQMDDSYDDEALVFDIVFDNPDCPAALEVTCAALAWDEIAIAWFYDIGEDWIVIYGPTGFDPYTEGDSAVAIGEFVIISGLEELTCYDYYVVPNCGEDVVSCLGPTYNCCTLEKCPPPSDVTASLITHNSIVLDWDYPVESICYDIEWGLEGFELGTGTSIECLPFEAYDLEGLESNECYDIYVRANCIDDDVSTWAGPFNFCTNVAPEDLNFEGALYIDENENGIRDIGEIGINSATVATDPEDVFAYTGADGRFLSSSLYFDEGVHEIFPTAIENWSITSDSLVYTLNVNDEFEARDSLDFGFYPDTSIHQVDLVFSGAFPRCNNWINYYLHIENSGTTIASGQVHLALDDSLEYISATVIPDSIVGQNIYWHYDDLYYFDSESIIVQVATPDGIDDVVSSLLTATIDSADVEVYSVEQLFIDEIVCAYDPNDKTPEPFGVGEFGNIHPETESIEYLIRFQNTGTDTAFNVVIKDQLDPNINWNSLTPLANSHEMEIEISMDGKVSFIFNDIMLPDSNVNEPASHGYVRYRVNLKEGLPLGTSIYNTANIYFDLNPAVVTNTTVNTLFLSDLNVVEHKKDRQILVYPNPFSESTTIYFGDDLGENSALQIVDLLGKQVYSVDRVSGNSIEIEASDFNKGIYILVLRDLDANEIYTTRLVVN